MDRFERRVAVHSMVCLNLAQFPAFFPPPPSRRHLRCASIWPSHEGTAHWMFDRGLIGIADDLSIVVSRHVNDRDSVDALINRTGKLIGPGDPRGRPHPVFLAWHRENCFKQ
jgi:hypothetical protein